jgi:threonine aldolase
LGDIHSAQPAIVRISNTTERGTFYNTDELWLLSQAAHKNGMLIHVDGARIFNAVVASGYKSTREGFREMYGKTGIDVISLGATKVGAMSAEAVVVLHPEGSDLVRGARFSQKQMGQLGSKARYSSAQFLALFDGDLAFKLAKYANDTTYRLYESYQKLTNATKSGVEFLSGATSAYATSQEQAVKTPIEPCFTYQAVPDANAFFPTMPAHIIRELRKSYHFYDIDNKDGHTTIRLMTSWATTEQELADFEATMAKIVESDQKNSKKSSK